MRLYKVEAIGFKSFKDKISIEVPEGIVGIVGPNGCGKSNVVDAVKWALGEQNPRHLRAKSMEDIIFAGTTEFSPLGMAEVSLYFRRVNEPFPEPYSNLTDLVITRRLYRSGESEYLINKSQCRLKDIVDITIDTGLGQRFYGLIEQGMVETFMNYKPEEKRLIFEEVAGTAKYRLRKKATLQKLESAKLNLDRVEDILAEVERRCNELEKEAKRAMEYKKVFEELKRIELHKHAHLYDSLTKTIQNRKNELELIDKTLQEKEIQASSLESELEVKKNDLFFLEKTLEEHKRDFFKIAEKLLSTDKELNAIKEGKGYRESKLQEMKTQKEKLIEKKDIVAQEVKNIENAIKAFETELSSKEGVLREAEKVETEIALKIKELTTQIASLQSENSKDKNQLAYTTSQITYEERLLADAKDRLGLLKTEGESLLEDITAAKETLEKQKSLFAAREREKDDLNASIEKLISQFNQERKNAGDLRRKLQEKELKRERLLGTYNSSKKFVEEYKGFSSGTQHILKNFTKNEVLGSLVEHIEVKEELLSALENFLKDKLELILVNDPSIACKAIEYLKKGNLGSCFFLPVNKSSRNKELMQDPTVSEYIKINENVFSVLSDFFSNLKVVKNINEAIERFFSGEICNFLTLEGDVLDEKGVIYGGSKGKHNPFILEKSRLKELANELSQITNEVETERNIIKKKEDLIRKIDEEIRSKRNELSTLNLELSDEKTELRLKEEDLKRKLLKSETLKQEIKNIELNFATYEKKKQDLFEKQRQLSRLITERETVLADKTREIEERRGELEKQREEITKLKVTIAEERRNIQHNRENRGRLVDQLNAFDGQMSAITKEEEALQKIDFEAEKKLKIWTEELEKLREEEAKLALVTKEEEEKIVNIRSDVREKDVALSSLRTEIEKLRKTSFNFKEKLNDMELKIKLIEERIREKYFVEIAKHLEEYLNLPVTKEESSDENIENKWKQLRDMGEVNLMSIDEYEEVKTRYDFLNKQKKDIEDAIASLNTAIERINKVSVEIFLNSIKNIEQNFDRLFKRLFGGGRAKIVLTDENNPLESGVDIVVEPPFKKFQNIDLLSGGEKALVALSLMFAFYMLKPSPFCILDEVDAPLDDANVVKFKELLKEMSSISQFMVVTHNKIVMESANVLYGVTMETPGVSKIVSVKTTRGEIWQ